MTAATRRRRDEARVRDASRSAGGLVIAALVVLILALVLHIGDASVDVRIGAGVIAATAIGLLLVLAEIARPSARGTMLDRLAVAASEPSPARPRGLRQAETSIRLALASAEGRDRFFRDEVRMLALARLGEDAAPSNLAPATWELIRPDRERDRSRAPGLTAAAVADILDDVERR
jgi:hypothetical protein